MSGASWLDELNGLLARFSELGIDADIGSMCLCELWGVYGLLKRLSGA